MIPIITTQQTVEFQTSTVGYRLTSLYTDIEDLNNLFFAECGSVKDITDQIPLWVIFEKEQLEDQGQTPVSIFDFIQKYYDWLYCDTSFGSEYQLGVSLLDLVDVERTRDLFVQRLASIYANGLEPEALVPNGGKISIESARNFIHNIRKNFYHKKTTLDGIKYFFKTLFSIPEDLVKVEYPKKYLLRLNGGRFYSDQFVFPGGTGTYESLNTLSGSCLNFSRLQDGNFYQDYSYLLKVGIKSSYYKNTYKKLAHPAGLKVIYEVSLEDYAGPDVDYDYLTVCERSYLRNYSPYGISFEYNNVIGSCGGVTYYGITACIGCCALEYGPTFDAPTFAFPNWNGVITGFNFKNIKISDFFDICYNREEIVSPNIGLTCGNC